MAKTPSASYYYERKSGGFSSIIDKMGNDWVSFKPDTLTSFPGSAASGFRGLPNLVYKGEDNGLGHPGFDGMQTVQVDYQTLISESRNGKWKWKITFFEDFVNLEVIKTDTSRNYWFLYEGPAGGKWSPDTYFWGSNEGSGSELPDYLAGGPIQANWDWVYFGSGGVESVLIIQNHCKDTLPDVLGYMGSDTNGLKASDGMVVFGFGRNRKTEAFLKDDTCRFSFGFIYPEPSTDLASQISRSLEKFNR